MLTIPLLTNQESAIYIASLELGSDTIQHIAKKANLPRSTVYLIIDQLKTKGLVSETKQGKKTFITAQAPSELLSYLENKHRDMTKSIQQIEKRIPELNAMYSVKKDKPIVSYFEGYEEIKDILEQTLHAKEIYILCSGYIAPLDKKLDQYLNTHYFPEVHRRKIITKEILGPSHNIEAHTYRFASKTLEVKEIKQVFKGKHIDKLICDTKIIFLSYEILHATIITDQHIADHERSGFKQLWDLL